VGPDSRGDGDAFSGAPGQRGSGRRLALAAAVLAAAFVGVWAGTRDGVPWVDASLHRFAVEHRSAASLHIATLVTQGGSTRLVWPLLALATVLYARSMPLRRWPALVVFVAGVSGGIAARLAVSILVSRARPPAIDWAGAAGGYAFPSGHTTAATLGAAALAWAVSHQRPRVVRLTVWSLAAVYAAAVGWSRVWLGVHWPLDVVGGWLFASAWLSTLAWATAATSQWLDRRNQPTAR